MDELLKQKRAEFEAIAEKHRCKLPIKEMAEFLGMKEENLRRAIAQKQIPGAFSTEGEQGNKAFYILPVPFYRWYFGGNV